MKRLRKLIICIIVFWIFTLIQLTPLSAKDYYVSKNGNDNFAGSAEKPWLTIQKAADTLTSGDSVFIKAGTYFEIVNVKHSGTANHPITFKGFQEEKPILDGSNSPQGFWGVLNIQGKNYIDIEDIEITGNTIGWGVLIEHEEDNVNNPATNIMLKELNIHHTGAEDIQVRGNTGNILINACVVHDGIESKGYIRSGIDIYKWGGGRPHDISVTNCKVYNYDRANKYNGVGGGIASEQADNLTISNNMVYNCKQGIDIGSGGTNKVYGNTIHDCIAGIALSSNHDTEIFNNTIYNIYDEAIYSYYWIAHGEKHTRNKWYNNIIYNAGFGIYESNTKREGKYDPGPTSDHEYFNNLFYKIGTHGSYRTPFYFRGVTGVKFYHNTIYMNDNYGALQFLKDAKGADIKNNIFSISGDKPPIIFDSSSSANSTIDYNCYQNRSGEVTGPGEHSIIEDPMFINPGKNDFRLGVGSPCIGSAVYLSAPFGSPNLGYNFFNILPSSPDNLRIKDIKHVQ